MNYKELQKRILSSLIILPVTLYFIFQETIFFAFFLSVLFFVCSYEWIKINKKDIIKIIGIFYLFFSFCLAYFLREQLSIGIFVLILVICIATDLGGYIFGKIFKGPKLAKISPKKTYSGAIGGFILSILSVIIYIKTTNLGTTVYLNLSIGSGNNLELNNFFLIFTLLISFVSQIGDLIISYFKRLAKVKNTGSILPGHGGLLDRVDGIIFAVPISYLFLTYLK